MKKITLLTGAVTACTLSFAQIGKGSLMLGGSLNMGSTTSFSQSMSSSESKTKSFAVSPSIGYAVRQNLFIGIGGTISSTKSTSFRNTALDGAYRLNGRSGFVFLRKYAGLGKGFYLFAEPAAYYGKNRQKHIPILSQDLGRDIKTSSLGLSLFPGISYAVNRALHLEVGLNRLIDINYSRQQDFSTQNAGQITLVRTTNNFNFSTNLNPATALSIGARLILAK